MDEAIQKKFYESWTTKLINSNKEIEDTMKRVMFLEESGLLTKYVSKKIKNEAKEQKEGLLSMLLGTLDANLLGNLLAGKGINRADEGVIRADENF